MATSTANTNTNTNGSSSSSQSPYNKKRSVYDVLGVEQDVDDDSVKKAYRQLAMKYHPDRNKGDNQAESKFKELSEAYEILKDHDRRIMYDRDAKRVVNVALKEVTLSRSPNALFEAVDQFFSSSGTISPQLQSILSSICNKKHKGATVRATLSITFNEMVFGCSKSLEIKRQEYCPNCVVTSQASPSSEKFCYPCQGTARLSVCRTMQVEVPAGLKRGEEQIVVGEGDVGELGAPPGDLVVVIDVPEHPIFRRDGDDVHTEITISCVQAMLGDAIQVPLLYGPVNLHIPSGTQPNDILKVSEQGFFNHKLKKRGDMYVKVNIMVPKVITPQQQVLLQQYLIIEKAIS